jgi:hypothetical protein
MLYEIREKDGRFNLFLNKKNGMKFKSRSLIDNKSNGSLKITCGSAVLSASRRGWFIKRAARVECVVGETDEAQKSEVALLPAASRSVRNAGPGTWWSMRAAKFRTGFTTTGGGTVTLPL